MTSPPAPARAARWRPTLPLAALLVGLLVWYWAVVLTASPVDPLPATAASSFLPSDATRTSVTFSQDRLTGNGMLENARLSGTAVAFGMSPAAVKAMTLPPDPTTTTYWREAVIPADLDQPTRYRIRSLDATGVHLQIQDWEQLGLSVADLLELPADVHAGAQWSSSGLALVDPPSVQLHYRNTSTARAPGRADRARAGCLQVSSRTTLTADDGSPARAWQEDNLWCPGAGIVEQHGTFRGHTYAITENTAPLGSIAPDTLQAPAFDATGLADWRLRSSPIVAGDQTFGEGDPDPDAGARPLVAANGVVAFPYAGTDDLTMLIPLNTGTLWQHWFGRPGGTITSSTVVGSVVVVATTERTLLAYNAGGRLRWSAALDDVAVAAPVALSPTRLAVATVGGTLTVFDATTSLPVWSTSTQNSVHNAIAGNATAVVVSDTDGNVTAYDSTTGAQLWSADAGSPFGSALAVDADTVFLTSGGFVSAHDLRIGELRWTRHVGGGLGGLARAGSRLLVENDGAIEAWSPVDGSTGWVQPDTGLAAADLGGCLAATTATSGVSFLLGARQLRAVADNGRLVRTWPVNQTAPEETVHCADGRVWLIGRSRDGSTPLTIASVGPA